MENEKNLNEQEQSANQSTENREGYKPAYRREYRSTGRPQRPRIQRPRIGGSSYQERNEEGGFRPEGFGAGLNQGQQRQSYRPRYNSNEEYQPRASYQRTNPQQGGYRPRYNQEENAEGGYQSRGGYQQRSGYQQRGYQQRDSRPQQQGYRPRYNQQEENAEGGYQPRGGYQQRQQRGYGQQRPQRGGYGQQRGGYSQGGYQQRGGYGDQQFGGGYNRRPRTAGYDPNAKYSMKKRIEYKETHLDPNEPIRLNKFLANAGVCSRREADDFITAGVVTVNGEVVTELGTKILRSDNVVFHEQPVTLEKKVYVLLNKPKDYVTTSDDPQQRKTVMDLVKDACPERIYPVGRLDRNTTGVLLLTNDGELASKLTHPKFLKKKVYHVFLDKPVTRADMDQIATGIELEDGEIHADAIEYADPRDKSQVGIEIHSGKNRIVRRIFESLGYRVTKLDRVQFAGLTKKNVRRGDWRFLTEKEVEMLRMGAFE